MFDLDQFVAECKAALSDEDPTIVIRELVQDAIADPQGLRTAFDGRITGSSIAARSVHRTDDLTVLDVSTPVGMRTPAHNHNMWAVIGVYDGEEHNAFFEIEKEGPVQRNERLLKTGDVAVLTPQTVHAISNPLSRKSYAVHVYGGDLVNRDGRSVWNPHSGAREDYNVDKLSAYVKEMMAAA